MIFASVAALNFVPCLGFPCLNPKLFIIPHIVYLYRQTYSFCSIIVLHQSFFRMNIIDTSCHVCEKAYCNPA